MFQFILKGDDVHFLIIVGAIIYTALVVTSNLYTYPLIARYENKLINMIKNSMAISVQFFGKTIFLCFLILLEVLLIFWNKWTLFVGILIGPEFIIYTVSGISKRIFQKIEKGTSQSSGTINQ